MYYAVDSVQICRKIVIMKFWLEDELGQSLDRIWRIYSEISVEGANDAVEVGAELRGNGARRSA